jgi:hypothetical protein
VIRFDSARQSPISLLAVAYPGLPSRTTTARSCTSTGSATRPSFGCELRRAVQMRCCCATSRTASRGQSRHRSTRAPAERSGGAPSFHCRNPVVSYGWLLTGGRLGYRWLNGLGVHPHEVPPTDDFSLTTHPGGPEWHLSSVVYEVFIDRFAASAGRRSTAAWAADGKPRRVQGSDQSGSPVRLVAREGDRRNLEDLHDLLRDCGEDVGGGRALRDERRHPSQRGLLVGKNAIHVPRPAFDRGCHLRRLTPRGPSVQLRLPAARPRSAVALGPHTSTDG